MVDPETQHEHSSYNPGCGLTHGGETMSGDKRQRTQTAVINGIRKVPMREGKIDSSVLVSDGVGSPAVIAFVEDYRAASGDRQLSQSLDPERSRVLLYNGAIQDRRMTFA